MPVSVAADPGVPAEAPVVLLTDDNDVAANLVARRTIQMTALCASGLA